LHVHEPLAFSGMSVLWEVPESYVKTTVWRVRVRKFLVSLLM
jgi:hypothetical protein